MAQLEVGQIFDTGLLGALLPALKATEVSATRRRNAYKSKYIGLEIAKVASLNQRNSSKATKSSR